MTKKKKPEKNTIDKIKDDNKQELLPYEIDPQQILLHQRNLFLHGTIDDKLSNRLNKEMLALAHIDKKPIALWINSGGGSISAGFSIIDTMCGLPCPVVTFINGWACSMAGLVSIAGQRRVMTTHSIWMGHEAYIGGDDYLTKLMDRAKYHKHLDNLISRHVKKYTDLDDNDFNKVRKGELWLSAKQCKQKGVIDAIARV